MQAHCFQEDIAEHGMDKQHTVMPLADRRRSACASVRTSDDAAPPLY